MTPPLELTGHPLVDVGIATLCAMANRRRPEDLTSEDLQRAADEMAQAYFSAAMIPYLTCVFPNSEFVQPGSGEKKDAKRQQYAREILGAYTFEKPRDAGATGKRCAFSGHPATHLIHRQQLPMFTGAEIWNFLPDGLGALPVAGAYVTAIQALPLGGRKAEGRLLIVHSDSWELTLWFAKQYLSDNRRILHLLASQQPKATVESGFFREIPKPEKDGIKYGDAKFPSSLVLNDLTLALRELDRVESNAGAIHTATAYWFSNSGQGPSLDLFHIPASLVAFLDAITRESTARSEWHRIVSAGWRRGVPVGKKQPALGGPGRTRNTAFADLTEVFESGFISVDAAARFVRFHLLGQSRNAKLRQGAAKWALVEIFLRELVSMDRSRIEAIRTFADRLAEHIKARNDKRFLAELLYAKTAADLRLPLVKAQRREYKDKNSLLFGLDDFLAVFEADDAVAIAPWKLVRDLISIRLIERLHELQFQPDGLFDEEPEEDVTTDFSTAAISED